MAFSTSLLFRALSLIAVLSLAMPLQADEMAEQNAIVGNVSSLLMRKDFSALNTLEAAYLKPDARTSSGIPKLSIFSRAIGDFNPVLNGSYDRAEAIFREWQLFSPQTSAPSIALASSYFGRAVRLRGTTYADAVPPENWPTIERNFAMTLAVLDKHRVVGSRSPAWYNLYERGLFNASSSETRFDAIMSEGTARAPWYYQTWQNAALFYTPRWHGSVEDIDRIARLAVVKTRATDGTGLYARVYWYMYNWWLGDRLFADTLADPTLMVAAMRDVAERYPSDWNHAHFAKFACLAGKRAEADRYVRLMKGPTPLPKLAITGDACGLVRSQSIMQRLSGEWAVSRATPLHTPAH